MSPVYLGSSGVFDHFLGNFAVEYADHDEPDHRAFVQAVRDRKGEAHIEA